MKGIKRLQSIGAATLAFTLLAGLGVFAWAGSFARLWADDYCYSSAVHEHGIIGATRYWYQVGGNRFAALWGVALSDLVGPGVTAWLPGLIILMWVGAWIFFLRQINRRAGWKLTSTWIIASSLAMVFFNLLMAPHLLQSLYWRMGMLHYTLPLVLILILMGLLARAWPGEGSSGRSWLLLIGTGLLAFTAAGLSETYAALQSAVLLAGLIVMCIFAAKWRRAQTAGVLLPALGASLAAMVIMAMAPANAWRQSALPPPASLVELVTYTLRYALAFVRDSLVTLPVPTLVMMSVFFALGWLAFSGGVVLAPRQVLYGIGFVLLVGFGLMMSSIAPSVYAGLQYPAGRALTVARFVWLCALGLAAWLVGAGMARSAPKKVIPLLSALICVILFLAAAYSLRAATYPLQEGRSLQVKAERWDARHLQILAAREAGMRDLVILETDVVSSLEDIGPDPNYWVNTCAAQYYGLNSLTALP